MQLIDKNEEFKAKELFFSVPVVAFIPGNY